MDGERLEDSSRKSSADVGRSVSHDIGRHSSHTSAASSRRSSTGRTKPRKYGSNTSLRADLASSDKSLTSFPSLSPSPENSPHKVYADPAKAAILQASQPPTSKITPKRPSIVDTLLASNPSARNRSSLFDDAPQDTRDIPGTLHHASDDHIRRLLARNGAVAFVRQLAEDLARRDAQITELRRRAEERERLLRKMLKECEITNLDIETRLRELEARSTLENGTQKGLRILRSRRSSNDRTEGNRVDDNMTSRLDEAMHDEFGLEVEGDLAQPVSPGQVEDINTTVRAKGAVLKKGTNGVSVKPEQDHDVRARRGTIKGIKDYFWSSSSKTSSRASSITGHAGVDDVISNQRVRANGAATARRPGLNDSTFRPPRPTMQRSMSGMAYSRASSTADLQSRNDATGDRPGNASNAVATWAMKLVAGGAPNGTESIKSNPVRGRAATVSTGANGDSRPPSIGSYTPTTSNQKRTVSRTTKQPRPSYSTVIATSPETLRSAASSIRAPTSPQEDTNQAEANLGPVEMDTILPRETRPPTLVQHHNLVDSSDFLTDRFGFIYDQRRKKRQNEAAAALPKHRANSSIETLQNAIHVRGTTEENDDSVISIDDGRSSKRGDSRPDSPTSFDHSDDAQASRKWQDYLKLATFPTELLSHTPSAAPTTTHQGSAGQQVTKLNVGKGSSIPIHSVNPEPSATHVSSNNAELAQISDMQTSARTVSTARKADPVKSLLWQVTALHDSLQKQKEARWNEFFRKVRAARQREGEGAAAADGRRKMSTMPEVSLTDSELIGVAGLGNKGRVGRAKWKEFRGLVLGGIPVAYRPKVWAECSGANDLRIPQYYDDLVNSGEDDPEIVNQIQMDITRTLTDNVFFRKGAGVHKLQEVLVAYSRRNPEVGYCQGMNLITACLLLIMPTAEDAFWVLATMVENILPHDYYDNTLLVAQADQKVLLQYVAEILPKLSAHFEALGIELEALTFQWFLSVFTDCLSAEALFRVWDVVLCLNDGSTFLFQVAVALLKLNEGNLLRCDTPAGVYHYINHEMTNHAISIDGLIRASEALKKVIKPEEVEERRKKAVEREREVARQRVEMRAGKKGKARIADEGTAVLQEGHRDGSVATSVEEVMSEREAEGRSLTMVDEFGNEQFGDLQVRTPMPIEEEALWRA